MDQEIKNTNKQEITQLKKEAEQGSASAQKILADRYLQGNGVEQNLATAVEWLKKAAEQGYFAAYFPLADCYFNEKGIKQDYAQAVKWLKECAAAHHVFSSRGYFWFNPKEEQKKAQCKLADCYFQGHGVEKSPVIAVEWLERAAEQGYEPAQIKLADCYFEGIGVEKNNKQAVEWLEKAAGLLPSPTSRSLHPDSSLRYCDMNKNRLAQRKLGFHYLKEENYTEAVKWFEEAVYSHDSPMQSPLEAFYSDTKQTVILKLENNEDIRAKTELGICYYHAKKHDSAYEIFNKLPKQNDCFWDLWSAYFTYLKNKPAAEKITAIDCIKYGCGITATNAGTLSPLEMENHNQRAKDLQNVKENEDRIAKLLHMAAAGLFLQDEETNNEYLDIVHFAFPDDVIRFLEDDKSTLAKVILAFYYRYKNESEFLALLKQASDKNDIIADYQLGIYFKNLKKLEQALEHFNKVERTSGTQYREDIVNRLVQLAIKEISNIERDIEHIKNENQLLKALHEKEKEMLSFFTHTMRNALATAPESLRQAIRLLGSDVYEKDTKHYQAINKIAALFSTLSLTDCLIDTFKQSISDPQEFKQSWQKDHTGEATPKWVIASALRQSLNRIIFMSDTSELRKLLNNPETALIKATRKSFIEEVLPLNVDSQGVEVFYDWAFKHIPAIEVSITASDKLNFGVNQIRFSLLFAITSELILNALKYWDGDSCIQISWQLAEQGNYVFSVKNHCKANATSNLAGTHKGLAFIKRLVELLGEHAHFVCKSEDQLFTAELILNKALFDGES